MISRDVFFAKGELGNRDLSVRNGDWTSSAVSVVTVPALSAAFRRACNVRMKLSRRCVYDVDRVGTLWKPRCMSRSGVIVAD